MRIIANEFAKMRHLRVSIVIGLLIAALTGLTVFRCLASIDPTSRETVDGYVWKTVFGNLGLAMTLVLPILLAVLASRQVEVEHLGNGWLLSGTSGVTPGRLCRAKFIALGSLVTAATVLSSLLLIAFSLLIGADRPVPAGRWVGYTISVIVINLAVLALQILLSAKAENQLVCLGIGVVGVFIAVFGSAMPAWVSHLTPWGYYALTLPADYVGTDLVYRDIPYVSVFALTIIGGAVFFAMTARFDRQEA